MKTGLGTCPTPYQWVLEVLSSRVKQSECIGGSLPPCVPRSRKAIPLHIYSHYTIYLHRISSFKVTFNLYFCYSFNLPSADISVLRQPFPMTQISRKAILDGYEKFLSNLQLQYDQWFFPG